MRTSSGAFAEAAAGRIREQPAAQVCIHAITKALAAYVSQRHDELHSARGRAAHFAALRFGAEPAPQDAQPNAGVA